MSLALSRREHLNVRLYFIPVGTVLSLGDGSSSLTVSPTAWPDNAPLTNWTNYEFDDIEKCVQATELEIEDFKIPKAAGGYQLDQEETIIKRMWTFTTSKTNAYLKRLQHATTGIVASGVAQAPGVNNQNFFTGVCLMEFQNKDGRVTERVQVWARLRIVSPGEVGPATMKIEFTIEQRDSGNNTMVVIN